MAGKLIDTIYGAKFKYEIREQESSRAKKFIIYRDGTPWRGEYKSLCRAVEVVKGAD